MQMSGATIVQSYLEKYVLINSIKMKKRRYEDKSLARFSLSVAFNIINEMSYLRLSNNANDFVHIKNFLREQVAIMHQEIKKNQPLLKNWLGKNDLPLDFGKCVNEAWVKLQLFEKDYKPHPFR